MKFWHNNLFCLQIQEYTTVHALVMEYIEGLAIDDKEKLLSDGYDMGEIDVMEVKMDLMEVMKENKTSMPQGLTMLARHVVIGLWVIAASDQLKHYLHDRYEGRDMGISAVGMFGYLFAFTIVLYLLIKHIFHSNLLVTYKGSIGDSRHDALNRKLRVKIKYNNYLVTCK